MWSICIVEYYSAVNRNKVLIHITTWVKLENIMLSERVSHKKNPTYCMIQFV